MYCPNCATPVSNGQKFCRSCGFDLQRLSKVFSQESLADEIGGSVFKSAQDTQSQKSKLQHRGVLTLMFGILVGCLIPINAGLLAYYPKLSPFIPILAGIAGFLIIAGVILMILADKAPEHLFDRKSSNRHALPQASETKKPELEADFESLPKIIEHTPDLLETGKIKISRKRT
jgi:zinc-ribbon domain